MITRLVSVAFVLGAVLPPVASADPSAELGPVRFEDGKAHVTLTTRDLPVLDPAGVRVDIDGTPVHAAATVAGEPPQRRAVLVVLDTTGTMSGTAIAAARGAVTDYLSALPPDVHTGLITFTSHPELTVPLTPDRQQVTAALARAGTSGSSPLNDAVAMAARTLAGVPGARRLLVLSDGEDADGGASLDGTLRMLSEAGVIADVVALDVAAGATAAGRDRIAHGSGGQVLTVAGAKAAVFAPAAPLRLEVTADVPDELSGRDVRLTVRVRAGGTEVVAGTGTRAPDRRGEVMPAVPTWLLHAMLGVVCTVLIGLGWLLSGRRACRHALSRRLAEVRRYRVRDRSTPAIGAVHSRPLLVRLSLALSERVVSARGQRERLELELDLAGVRLRPAEWLLVRFGTGVVLGVVLAAASGELLVGGPFGALLGWFACRVFLKARVAKRRSSFGEQLPDTLQLVAGALRSGFSLPQALDGVVREGSQPIAGEFARSLARTRLGVSVEDALAKAAERMECQDLAWVVMAIRIQREVGGNLAELLLTTVHTMRERATVRRQVKALTAEGKMSAYVLISLPIGIGSWMFMTRRDYLEPLYTRPMGWAMLAGCVTSLGVGWFWMSRLIKVEV
ncbi:VWA domain-containing protein [Lentzea tibetensis]|uniref:VWA domain-containing protein n=1 Tax=Lentzea tibetensis TaxID=2591470 RepID=A0A563EXC7_9PSEU|nr:type II secretion system F family protein [Lentzea tibetensis]TWP52387.1 VWA domain-containing protein [Lentzea tibetensis]